MGVNYVGGIIFIQGVLYGGKICRGYYMGVKYVGGNYMGVKYVGGIIYMQGVLYGDKIRRGYYMGVKYVGGIIWG